MLTEKICEFDIPVVTSLLPFDTLENLVAYTRDLEDAEGFVVAFHDGHRVKIKADQYVRIHKCLERVRFDRNIVDLIINEELDDVVPLMPPHEVSRIREYEDRFWAAFRSMETHLLELHDVAANQEKFPTRKDVAVNFIPKLHDKRDAPYVFRMLDGVGVRELLLDAVRKNINSNTKWESFTEWMKV